MKVDFYINEKFREPEIHICNCEMNEELRAVAETVSAALNDCFIAYRENEAVSVNCDKMIRIYAQNQKTFVQTAQGEFVLHEKLYELETRLERNRFVRISKSELVNLRMVERLDTSLTGTIKMYLRGGIETYVSRRNVTKIKQMLGMKGGKS